MKWIAKNKVTGKEYVLDDAQKAHYETSPHLEGKYTFKPATAAVPKGVEKVVEEKPKKAKAEPTQEEV